MFKVNKLAELSQTRIGKITETLGKLHKKWGKLYDKSPTPNIVCINPCSF